jgi:hypothetical protein
MKGMFPRRPFVAVLVAIAVAPAAAMLAQANAAGEWRVTFVVPTGTRSGGMRDR